MKSLKTKKPTVNDESTKRETYFVDEQYDNLPNEECRYALLDGLLFYDNTQSKAGDCYELFKTKYETVYVWVSKNKVGIYIDLIICFGMPIDAIINSVRNSIKYRVENFSGMEVLFVDIRVMGIRK